jgi:CheY-like chemotaxis protein
MPKLDGFATCERLKADPATRHIPVIFLTASTQQGETQRGLALGAVGYLHKPFDPLELPQQVLSLLSQARLPQIRDGQAGGASSSAE